MLLCLFFIISKSLCITFAFLCCKEGTYIKLRLLLFLWVVIQYLLSCIWLIFDFFTLLSSFFQYHYYFFLFLSSLFLFGRFDECLIFSLIVSLWCEFFFKEWEWHLFFSLFLWLLSLTNYFTGFFVIEKYGNLKL